MAVGVSNGFAIAGFVLGMVGAFFGLLLITFVLALALGALAIVFGFLGIRPQRTPTHPNKGFAVAGVCLGVLAIGLGVLGATVTNGFFDRLQERLGPAADTDTEIHQESCVVERTGTTGTYERASALGTITNLRDDERGFLVHVAFLDPSGVRIADDYTFVDSLAPGEAAQWAVTHLIDGDHGTISCRVTAR